MPAKKTIALALAATLGGLALLYAAIGWGQVRALDHELESAQAKLEHQRYILAFEENALKEEGVSLNQELLKIKIQGQSDNDPRPRLILDNQAKRLIYKDSRHQMKVVPVTSTVTKVAALTLTHLPPKGTPPGQGVVELSDGSAMMGAAQASRATPEDDIVWASDSMDELADTLYVGMPLYVY